MEKVFTVKVKTKIQQPEIQVEIHEVKSKVGSNSKMDDIHLAAYFQPYINFCYYILFVPFKIDLTSPESNNYCVRTNPIQKFMCGIIHPIICINGFFEFHSVLVGNVRQSPEIFMRAIDRGNTIMLRIIFFYTVWFKKKSILAICNHSISLHRNKAVKRMVTFSYAALLTFGVFTSMAELFLVGEKCYNIEYGFRKLLQKYRFQYYFTNTLGKVDEHEILSGLTIVGTIFATLLRFYIWMLLDFVSSLTLLTGFVAYKVSKKFKTILIQFLDCTQEEDAQVFEAYSRTKIIFNKLNDFIGPIYLVVFLIITTYWAINVFDAMDSDGWIFRIGTTIYLILSFLIMAFSAEAHYQANYFRTWLLANPRRSSTNFLFEIDQWNLAIKGNRFFTVTYGFLGTAISGILTLTIIMIQFNGNPNTTSSPA